MNATEAQEAIRGCPSWREQREARERADDLAERDTAAYFELEKAEVALERARLRYSRVNRLLRAAYQEQDNVEVRVSQAIEAAKESGVW